MPFCVGCLNFTKNENCKEFGFCNDFPDKKIKEHFRTTGVEVYILDENCKNYKPNGVSN